MDMDSKLYIAHVINNYKSNTYRNQVFFELESEKIQIFGPLL